MKKKSISPIRIAAIGDLHLTSNLSHTPIGSTYRTDQLIKFFRNSFELMLSEKVDLILNSGDLCDEVLIGPETMELLTCFLELSRVSEISNVMIGGNHDFDGDDCFLNFINRLDEDPKVFHFDPEPVVWEFESKATRVVAIPFCSDEMFLNQAVKGKILDNERKDFYNILLAHIGIKGAGYGDTISKFGIASEKIEEISNGYDLMVFGHFHKFQIIGKNGLYTGSPQHVRLDQKNIIPGFPIIDLPSFKIRHISNGFSPRFMELEDYEKPSGRITNNIIKPIIDTDNVSEEDNEKYLREILSLNPYHMIRPTTKKKFAVEEPIRVKSITNKESIIVDTMKKMKVKEEYRKPYKRHVIELFREVSQDVSIR